MKRATDQQQKQQRRDRVIDAGWVLFQSVELFTSVKMADVALQANLAKGTVYLYFKTKEALYLAVAQQQLGVWFEAVLGDVQELEGGFSAEILSTTLASSLTKHPHLRRLLALLYPVLIPASPATPVADFDAWLAAQTLHLGKALEHVAAFIPRDYGDNFVKTVLITAIGAQNFHAERPTQFEQTLSELCRAMLVATALDALNGKPQ